MKLKAILSASFSALLALSITPANAEDCPDGICEVVFQATGSGVYFEVPENAENLSFSISGAAGGRGGNGGRVTGSFLETPVGFWVYVGGEGAIGSEASGGFNGGGRAGGTRGNEGSGGGASDIRTTQSVNDRIVVAGGGGGGGGYAGAAGGVGGNLIAADGGSGQGTGGLGGGTGSGGQAGSSNGGSAASSGSFAVGGTGGSSWNAGGGGGGGGWYGGGGGGADDDSCCSDAGGGGGGSSFAEASLFQDIVHEAGVQAGAGQVIIRYELRSEISSFQAVQESADLVVAQLQVTGSFVPAASDLQAIDANCTIAEPELISGSYNFNITGCSDSDFELSTSEAATALLAEGVSSPVLLTLDLVGPSPSLIRTDLDADNYSFEVVTGEEVTGLELADFTVTGCDSVELSGQKLNLSQCQQGEISVILEPFTVADSMGNLGPTKQVSASFVRDTVPPVASWSVPVAVLEEAGYRVSLELLFDGELVVGSEIAFSSLSAGCLPVTSVLDGGILFEHSGCEAGTLSWLLPANSLIDQAGNLGPANEVSAELVLQAIPEPEPEPEPEQAPEQEPTPVAEDNPPVSSREPIEQPTTQSPVPVESPVEDPAEAPEQTEQLVEELEDLILEEIAPEPSEEPNEPVSSQATVADQVVEASPEPIEAPMEVTVEPRVQTDPEILVEPTTEAPIGVIDAELAYAAEPNEKQRPGFVELITPWLAGSIVLGTVGFLAYRKIMVR